MSRIILSLLLFFPGTAALAAEATLVPDGSDCPEVHGTAATAKQGTPEAVTPGRETRATPRLQGSAGDPGDRLPTHSWRSFLPGMLR